jgi:hypothetical protein
MVALEMAELLLDHFTDLIDSGLPLLGHAQKLLPGLLAACARLMSNGFSGLRMHHINQPLGQLTGFIKK